MQLINAPGKLVLPFAEAGGKNTIPVDSQIGITAGAASLKDGFPPLTRTPLAAGGTPPSGLDMNGILYELSAIIRWANAGAGFVYDATFATDTNVAGYPKGARVLRSDGLGYWFNTVDDNTTDPEAGGAGWVPDYTSGVTAVTMTGSNVTLTALQYGKPTIVISGTLTTNLNLIFPSIAGKWTVINNTAGPYTITCKTAAGTGAIVNTVQAIVGDGTNIYSSTNDAIAQLSTLIATAGGTADALTATFSPAPRRWPTGVPFMVRAASANATATPTFTANSGTLTAKTIVKASNTPLVAGDIAGAGHWLLLQYDATLDKVVLLNPGTSNVPVSTMSRYITALANNTASSGYWMPIATWTPHPTLSDGLTLRLRVIGAINLRGAVDLELVLTQDPTLGLVVGNCSARTINGVAVNAAYMPQFKAVAASTAVGSMVTLYVQMNATYVTPIIYEISKAQYQAAAVLAYLTGQSWSVTEPSGAFEVKSYSGSFGGRQLANVIDVSNLTVDTILQPGETAIVSWTSTTSKALRINTTNGGIFEIDVDTDMGGPDAAITLSPNNTSYGTAISDHVNRTIANTTQGLQQTAGVFQLAYGQKNSNSPMFASGRVHIGSTGASANALKRYEGVGYGLVAGVNETRRYASVWIDNSTLWSSLGTLSFGNACSGTATIRRIS
jgi:hypothetical protein